MARGRATRLGGEFQVGKYSIRGRRLFFEAFGELHPEAVNKLRQIAGRVRDRAVAVDTFCDRYNLWRHPADDWRQGRESDWLRQVVLDTVGVWKGNRRRRRKASWMVRHKSPETADGARSSTSRDKPVSQETRLKFLLMNSVSWDPLRETEVEFLQRVDTYIKERKRRAEARGLVPTQRKHRPEHFEWLVRYHVDQERAERIASSAHVSRAAMQDAVTRVAHQIGLTIRRASKGGRPPKPARSSRP